MYEIGFVVAIVIAISQFLKLYVPTNFIPLVTLVLGIIGGYFFVPFDIIQESIMNGVIIGLSANGLYDVTKMLHK